MRTQEDKDQLCHISGYLISKCDENQTMLLSHCKSVLEQLFWNIRIQIPLLEDRPEQEEERKSKSVLHA